MPACSDLYALLQVDERASTAEIRRAFRRQALLAHPDKTDDPAAPARFRALLDAVAVLADDAARAQYDATRAPRGARSAPEDTARMLAELRDLEQRQSARAQRAARVAALRVEGLAQRERARAREYPAAYSREFERQTLVRLGPRP